ncbi:MAG TPA: hypothetical protein PKA10_18405 [Selenomonadales bacterium]|nr:hypothetical protein [Selenomonadales bacterium]
MSILFQKETVTRANLASWLYSKLVAAGWEQISSNISTDGYVFRSSGEAGDCDYYINLNADFFATGGGGINQYGINLFPCLGYTPGVAGAAGTFVYKQSSGIYQPAFSAVSSAADREFTFYYSVNKDRVVFVNTFPLAQGSSANGRICSSFLMYVGIPERRTRPNAESKVNAGNFLWVMNPAIYSYLTPVTYFFTPTTGSMALTFTYKAYQYWTNNNIPYAPGRPIPLIPMSVTDGTTDFGFLDGLYVPPANIPNIDGDIINVGAEQFRVCWAYNSWNNIGYPFCIRVG